MLGWASIFKPIMEGGLGIRSSVFINVAIVDVMFGFICHSIKCLKIYSSTFYLFALFGGNAVPFSFLKDSVFFL